MSHKSKNAQLLFLEAVENIPSERWNEFLDDACDGDVALRDHVQRLLDAHCGIGGFMEKPAVGVVPTDIRPITEQPGDTIGPYKLLQQIGEGGMGTVFMAEQTEPVERRVALKIIKPGMDTQQVIARFEAERQALAMMDHPNIAKVLDAGTTDSGRPYFVMELVKGVPITDYCDEQHLTPKERLELFVPICQAVQHAHQKGIIHRDVKPTNILVALYDGKPVPKVIDFGVAKATSRRLTEKTMFTQYGQIVGTIEYMSPEQAQFNQLDVDTRSDIYSLGVLLYELLTGETPFDKERLRSAAFDEVLRILREEEPLKPSLKLSSSQSLPSIAANRHVDPHKLSSLVRGELDWIVMKALEKDRGRRYETASAFAADVEHYLQDEPVTACPPSAAYRFRKFARRNKTVIATTAVIVVSVLVVAGGLGWMARDRAARRALMVQEVTLALQEAEEWQGKGAWPQALTAARRAESLLSAGETNEPLEGRIQELLRSLKLLSRLEQIRTETVSQLAYERSGKPRLNYAEADRDYAAAFGKFGLDPADLPDRILDGADTFRTELAAALHGWAAARRANKDDTWKQLLDAAQVIDPDPWRKRVRRAWAEDDGAALEALADSVVVHEVSPATLYQLARALDRVGNKERASSLLRESQRVYAGDFWINCLIAEICRERNEFDDAIRFYTAAKALRPGSDFAIINLGGVLTRKGRFDEAVAELREGMRRRSDLNWYRCELGFVFRKNGMLEEAIGQYRSVIDADPKDANAHNDLGCALLAQGKLPAAIASFRTALQLDPEHVHANSSLGVALSDIGRLDEAVPWLRKAVKLDADYVQAHINLAATLKEQGKVEEATAHYQKAIEVDPTFAPAHCRLGDLDRDEGKLDKAIIHYRNAIDADPNYVNAHVQLGAVLCDDFHRYDAAIAEFRKAIEIDPNHAVAHHNLGVAFYKKGELEEAIMNYRNAIDADPNYMDAHLHLGAMLCDDLHRYDEAIAEFRKAIEIDPNHAVAHHDLGVALHKKGEFDEAIVHGRRAMELDPERLESARLHTSIAWRLATAPDPAKRNPMEAVKHAQRAVELKPERANHWSNLGVAEYRAGNWPVALDALRRADQMRDGQDDYHRFFLAMACYRTGRHDEAKKHYVKAARWLANRQPSDEQERFREEAEELMAITPDDRRELILQSLSENIAEAPAEAARWAERARFHAEHQAWDESAADWVKVIELSDDNFSWKSPRKIACLELAGRPEVFHRAVKLRPDESAFWIGRAQYRALRSQWAEAAGDYAQAFASRPVGDQTVFEYATALLLAGNVDEYQRVCSKVAAHAAESDDSFAAFVAARTCGIGPADNVDPRQLVDWAAERLQDDEQPWVLHVLGLAQYRAGEFDQAIGSLTASNAGNWGTAQVQNDLVLAMAHSRLGHLDEAQTSLRQATDRIEDVGPDDAGGPAKEQVIDWIAMEALRHEAERLIESSVNHQKESAASERSR